MPYKSLSSRNIAGCGSASSVSGCTSPGVACYRRSLAPRFGPHRLPHARQALGLRPEASPSEFPFALSCCTAAQDWQPAETHAAEGRDARCGWGLRLDIELSVIG